MDETTQSPVEFFPGVPFTACAFQGKLYADTWEGSLIVTGNATLTALDVYGNELGRSQGRQPTAEPRFPFPEICPLPHTFSSASKNARESPRILRSKSFIPSIAPESSHLFLKIM